MSETLREVERLGRMAAQQGDDYWLTHLRALLAATAPTPDEVGLVEYPLAGLTEDEVAEMTGRFIGTSFARTGTADVNLIPHLLGDVIKILAARTGARA
ncbi:hypothetical protein [Nocardioides aurantiacus]|uniref:Uncharacterized protein n=1 Tax=Nocardioides aurantiacus TaxID=86796 RepID=A0A3N2CX02_9ACTN|nr:hypothetical protein [Nocardioides aurantiacus]ROR91744.1 hypothetical protein EDD33_2619 [Nocardioides aurantiacus]